MMIFIENWVAWSRRPVVIAVAMTLTVPTLTAAAMQSDLPAPVRLTQSPWNGDWVLSETLNPKEIKDAAAKGYRFKLSSDGGIRWEIPTLNEVVEGHTDGRPMTIRRPGSIGLSLAVKAIGDRILTYQVRHNGVLEGEGRMTLVNQGQAWVDISQPASRPDLASAVIYVRAAT